MNGWQETQDQNTHFYYKNKINWRQTRLHEPALWYFTFSLIESAGLKSKTAKKLVYFTIHLICQPTGMEISTRNDLCNFSPFSTEGPN